MQHFVSEINILTITPQKMQAEILADMTDCVSKKRWVNRQVDRSPSFFDSESGFTEPAFRRTSGSSVRCRRPRRIRRPEQPCILLPPHFSQRPG